MDAPCVLGVIPARAGSKRLPDKNIMLLRGKPLVAYTIEAALAARLLDRVVVSTDSDKIADVSRVHGAEVIRRPDDISGDDAPIDEAVRHAVRYLEEAGGYKADVAVLMQANLPVRADGVIDNVIEKLLTTGADSVATAYEVDQYPEWMKLLDGDRAVPYMEPGNAYRAQDLDKRYLLDGAALAIRVDVLKRTSGDRRAHAFLGSDLRLVVQEKIYSIEVDDRMDFLLAGCMLDVVTSMNSSG